MVTQQGTRVATSLRITAIHNRRTGALSPDAEYLVLFNEGAQARDLAGAIVTTHTVGLKPVGLFALPATLATSERPATHWALEAGAKLVVHTGAGEDRFYPRTARQSAQYHVYMGRRAFVWAAAGDLASLRRPDRQPLTPPFPIP
jgi:hypothetical protein